MVTSTIAAQHYTTATSFSFIRWTWCPSYMAIELNAAQAESRTAC